MRFAVIRQVTLLALREYIRTPEAMFWTYGFPLVMAIVLGLAFGERENEPARVALVVDSQVDSQIETGAVSSLVEAFDQHAGERLQWSELDTATARRQLQLGGVDLIVAGSPQAPRFVLDPQRPNAELAQLLVEGTLRRARGESDAAIPKIEAVDEPGDRYIDFLIPGLIAINLLGAGIYGVGYNIVMMRARNLLRRLWVTPIGRAEFLMSFLLGRLVLSLPPQIVILLFGVWVFGVPVQGSVAVLAGVILVGAFVFTGLGLLVACRARTLEQVSGLMNVVLMPMWLLGGAFFSNERFPEWLQPVVKAVPLTYLTDALRGVMLGTAEIGMVGLDLAVLAGFGVVCFFAAIRLFRWT